MNRKEMAALRDRLRAKMQTPLLTEPKPDSIVANVKTFEQKAAPVGGGSIDWSKMEGYKSSEPSPSDSDTDFNKPFGTADGPVAPVRVNAYTRVGPVPATTLTDSHVTTIGDVIKRELAKRQDMPQPSGPETNPTLVAIDEIAATDSLPVPLQGGFCGTVSKSRPQRKRHYAGVSGDGKAELLYLDPQVVATAVELNGKTYANVFGPFRVKGIAELFIEQFPKLACVSDATRLYNKQRELELKQSLRDQ